MSAFAILDETTTALRLIDFLYNHGKPISVVGLHTQMKKQYNVGRGAVDTARPLLEGLDLITYNKIKTDAPREIHAYVLTAKGRAVAEKLLEIKELLE